MNVTQLSLSTEKCVFSATRMHTPTSAMLCTRMAQRRHDADALKCACMPQLENLLNAVITSGPTNKERLYSVNKPLTFSSRCSKATVPCQSGQRPPPLLAGKRPHAKRASGHCAHAAAGAAGQLYGASGTRHSCLTRHARAKNSL